jgi:hypothetical protein
MAETVNPPMTFNDMQESAIPVENPATITHEIVAFSTNKFQSKP